MIFEPVNLPATLLAGGAFITALTGAIVTLLKLSKMEIKIDGRLTQLLAMNKISSKAEGKQEEREEEQVRKEDIEKKNA